MHHIAKFAVASIAVGLCVPAHGQSDRYDALANNPMFENRRRQKQDTQRRVAISKSDANLSMGVAADQ